ncbi:MAG: hypothetical protein IPJ32_21685 [Sphingobacteriaceae bacterium]|nr:hypothetical protein [Sphingobacteriaceae bacterium]
MPGYYVIISSLTPDFKYSSNLTSYAQVISSDITTIERRKDDGSYDFYAVHRQTGEPLKILTHKCGTKIQLHKPRIRSKKGESLKTDDKGYFNML